MAFTKTVNRLSNILLMKQNTELVNRKRLKTESKCLINGLRVIKGLQNRLEERRLMIIMREMERGRVDKVLSEVDANGKVTTYKLDENGNKIGEWNLK